MSQENVELIRRACDAFNRGDYEGWLAALDPEVELDERYVRRTPPFIEDTTRYVVGLSCQ
jgi:ketosteroid isomerase-like protein